MNKLSLSFFDFLKGRKTLSFFKEFQRTQSMSIAEIEEYQLKKLKKMLYHASKTVPFYQERFKEVGFSIDDLNSIKDLEKIPALTRSDLQNEWERIVSNDYNIENLSRGSSSGSTGLPVTYFKDPIAVSAGQAGNLFGWTIGGWKMNDKGLHIWGNPNTVNIEWKRLSSRLKAKVFKHHKFPAYKLTDGQHFEELRLKIEKEKYDYLDGYTNAIYLFADYLRMNDIRLKSPVKYVLTTGENLQDFQRETIENYLAPVYDSYGCSEINGIAYECKKNRKYLVIEPHVVVEFGDVVDDIGTRELIVTDLDNFAFPLIRYKLNDLAVPAEYTEDCDLPYQQLVSITGRQSDILRFKDGGTLSVPSFFGSMLLKKIQGIKQYQIVRVEEDMLHVRFVVSNEFNDSHLEIVNDALKTYLGDKIKYEVQLVDHIEVSKTGKFKLLVDLTKEK